MSAALPRRTGFGMAESVGLGFRIGFVAMLLLTVGWAVGNLRQVPADSRAVVQRFAALGDQVVALGRDRAALARLQVEVAVEPPVRTMGEGEV